MNLVSENIQIAKIGKIIKSMYPKAKIKYEQNTMIIEIIELQTKKPKMIKFKPNYKIVDGIKRLYLKLKKKRLKNYLIKNI